MKVNFIVAPHLVEDYAEIHGSRVTDEISEISELIQNKNRVITGVDEYDRIIVIDEAEILSLYAEKSGAV